MPVDSSFWLDCSTVVIIIHVSRLYSFHVVCTGTAFHAPYTCCSRSSSPSSNNDHHLWTQVRSLTAVLNFISRERSTVVNCFSVYIIIVAAVLVVEILYTPGLFTPCMCLSCMCTHSSCPDWQWTVMNPVAISHDLCAIASTMCCFAHAGSPRKAEHLPSTELSAYYTDEIGCY